MTDAWTKALEQSADVLGEMLVDLANGEADYSHEDIAAAALNAGLGVILQDSPSEHRIEEGARAIYSALHDQTGGDWASLAAIEKPFWRDIGRAAVRATDRAVLEEIAAGGS